VSFNHEGDDNGDKLRQQVTIKYTDDYYVSSVTQLYWESNDHGELDGPYEYRDEMEYNAEGKVTKVTISEHYDGNETRRDEISNVFVGNTVSSNEVQYRLTDGNLVKQSSQTETYTYDENGRTIGYTFTNFDSEGKRERILEKTYEYDERGNKLKEIEISSFGSTEIQDTITTEYVYNDRNQQIKFTRVQTKGYLYIKSAHEYEYHDNTVRKKWTLTSYGADGTVSDVRIEEFDELGKDTFHEYIHYNNGQKIDYSQTTYTYGESGDIMIEECKTFNSSGILTGGILNRYEYTAEGKLSKTFITKYDKDENIILEEVRDHLAEQKPTP
jgi:YD repeat-containing protein